MKNILLSIFLLTACSVVSAMENPAANEVTDYLAKHSIISSIEKAQTSSIAVKTINELIKSPALSKQAQEGGFDQLILDAIQTKFPKSRVPFFELTYGIGNRLAQNYFKNIRDYNNETDQTIVKKLLQNNWTFLVGKGIEDTEANVNEQMSQVIQKYTSKVICSRENQVVGFITYSSHRIFGECSIKFIAVDDHAQGNGYGRTLLECAQYHAQTQKLNSINLRVFQNNTSAINFYRNLGFMSLNHNYHMPAFTMKKEI